MKVVIVKDIEEVARAAADLVAPMLNAKPRLVLGLPTGSTAIPFYRELARRHSKGLLSLAKTTTFNLDEFFGIEPSSPYSYRQFMEQHLFSKVEVKSSRTHLLNGLARSPERDCLEYEKKIRKAGGIDLQILGIGENGHIGFNEPFSGFGSRTRLVDLAETTLRSHARNFPAGTSLPRQALTMGIGTILEARQILLLAAGPSKADAIAEAIEGPVRALCPASSLQLHAQVTYVVDREAASRLRCKSLFG